MQVLVIGGYGFIGTHIVRRLLAAGHAPVGLGRRTSAASRRFPEVAWVTADLASLRSTEAWASVLERVRCEAIVNAAGALQDGATDNVEAVQYQSMQALYAAAPRHGVSRFVQISATRAGTGASTTFMRSKGKADAALAASQLDWVILRPGLVLSPDAYGGTALLRALAAMPIIMPVAFAASPVQTVAADDVAEAVLRSLDGTAPARHTYDLVEDSPHTLREVQLRMRAWLGLAPVPAWEAPPVLIRAAAIIADGLGWLGWRSPLRSTAVAELRAGIRGDPEPWRRATGHSLKPLEVTLRSLPSTVQERWFARVFLLKPVAIGVLAAFWTVTGCVALAFPEEARRVLITRGVGEGLAQLAVVCGSLVDIGLGLGILAKPFVRGAALGMLAATLAYVVGGTALAPDLWVDPLGPLLKAVPALVPALFVLAVEGDR